MHKVGKFFLEPKYAPQKVKFTNLMAGFGGDQYKMIQTDIWSVKYCS